MCSSDLLKTKTETSKISYIKEKDKYTYSFDVKNPTNNIVYVVESIDYIDILNTKYKGHLITGNKWIDFEGASVKTANVNRIDDNKIEVWEIGRAHV